MTRVWVLHERRITDFPGTFGEWEAVSAERLHAARVAATEEEALRRVRERKQVRAAPDPRKEQQLSARAAQRELESAEAEVALRETQVAAITHRLEDPALYQREGGAEEAVRLGRELEAARTELDRALAAWESASAAVDAFT